MFWAVLFASGSLASGLAGTSLWLHARDLRYLLRKRLERIFGIDPKARRARSSEPSLLLRAAREFAPIGERLHPGDTWEIERLLNTAGRPWGLTVSEYLGLKVTLALLGVFSGLMVGISGAPFGPFLWLAFGVVGYLVPDWWLRQEANERQARITVDLPDYLDAMSVLLRAGLPLDTATEQLALRTPGPLGEEFLRLVRELRIGVPRQEAYKNLLNRNKSPELQHLVQSLLQGIQLGVPVSQTFALEAHNMRLRRIHRARELASKADPKIALVNTLLITPAAFFLILALVILNFLYNPEAMGLGGIMR